MMAVPCDMLLHPELLSNEQLLFVLQERHLRVPDIQIMARPDLLDLFHQFCVPYGQRKYRDSGRGKILNKLRHTSPERVKLNAINNNQCGKAHHPEGGRLKPPPDLLSGHMKRIKLDTKAFHNNFNTIPNKRRMSIDNLSQDAELSPCKKERKVITWKS